MLYKKSKENRWHTTVEFFPVESSQITIITETSTLCMLIKWLTITITNNCSEHHIYWVFCMLFVMLTITLRSIVANSTAPHESLLPPLPGHWADYISQTPLRLWFAPWILPAQGLRVEVMGATPRSKRASWSRSETDRRRRRQMRGKVVEQWVGGSNINI